MKKLLSNMSVTLLVITAIPGCTRILDWGKDKFYQGEQITPNVKVPRDFIRSVVIYDQLDTVGMFDVMWLTDDVRRSYVDLNTMWLRKDEIQSKAFLRRQLEENNQSLVFYVLAPSYMDLTVDNAEWRIRLQVDDQYLEPHKLDVVDLSREYRDFFGEKYNRFKKAYTLIFNAKNNINVPYIKETTAEIKLHFQTLRKHATLTWPVDHAVINVEEQA